ncbi:MAG: transcriptional repressor [Deltaproteobacteria bacterium]|nr:transcriptional repressor [Deltaproteobacteria bacterium]
MALHDSRRSEKRFQQMLDKLRSLDFRITPQRLAVLRILSASEDHPTAEQIFEKVKTEFPTTSLATIYKTIALLKSLNEVLELGFPDGSNRYDGNKPFPHPHVVCVRCRKIMDPELISLDELKDEISKKTGFRIQHHRLDFFGLCRECQEDA